MHIGFDISQTGAGKAGCGYFAHAMIQSLLELAPEHRYTLYPSFGDFYFDGAMPRRCPYAGENVQYGPRHANPKAARDFWTAPTLETALGTPDLIHANNFWCPAPLANTRLIYTLHDIGFLAEPSWTTEANRVGCFEGVFRAAVAADWVVAVSEASRRHYLSVFPHFPEERVRVVHPCSRFTEAAVEGQRPAALANIPAGRFWLSVGTIEPRKNQRRLVQAYADYLAQGGDPMPLVLAGGKGWLMEDFQNHVQALGIATQIVMTGYVSDEELTWLYRHCYANLYPSLFEGFGLPVLEGMQFGAATLCSNAASLPEVAGSAAVLLPPEDTAAWTDALLKLVAHPEERQRLSAAAQRQAGRFAWRDSAAALLELYAAALAAPKRTVPA
jgi:glycosyltransferase involved in cell wall biosynthesis